MNVKLIAVILIIAIIGIVAFLFMATGAPPIVDDWEDDEGKQLGQLIQTIRVDYIDGTTTTVGETQWIYTQDKAISTLTYILKGSTVPQTLSTPATIPVSVDLSNYHVSIEIINASNQVIGNEFIDVSDPVPIHVGAQETKLVEYTFSPYDFIDYDYFEDGYYIARVTPSGSILADGVSTNLPGGFEFGITVVDERAINIEFR